MSEIWPPDPEFRQPPHSIEAEQALLGAIFVNNEALDQVEGILEAVHFFDPLHGRIYEACRDFFQQGKTITPITLKPHFEREDKIGELTVPQYFGRLVANAVTIVNARDYAQTIFDLAVRRSLIQAGEDMVKTAYDLPLGTSPLEVVEKTESTLLTIAQTGRDRPEILTMSDMLGEAIDTAALAYKRDIGLAGIPTGFRDLDHKMGGMAATDLIILAGRPSMGKTALATNIGRSVARAHDPDDPNSVGCPVGFLSLEMSAEQLATRMLAESAEIPSDRVRRGRIERHDFDRLVEVSRDLQTIPFYADQTSGLTIQQATARARRMKRQYGIGLLIVDYLQLMVGTNRYDRVAAVSEITRGLKQLAKDLGIPVLALSQLSRQVETRDDKRPHLGDLRESGSIEQDADVVLFVYREEYYVERKQPREGTKEHLDWQDQMKACEGLAEVIIGKQRHGSTGVVKLQFDAALTRFKDYADPAYLPSTMEMFG